MTKFYINGREVTERHFKILNYLYNPLNHYAIISEKDTRMWEWGRIPKLIMRKKLK